MDRLKVLIGTDSSYTDTIDSLHLKLWCLILSSNRQNLLNIAQHHSWITQESAANRAGNWQKNSKKTTSSWNQKLSKADVKQKVTFFLVLKSFRATSSWKICQSIFQLLFHTATGLSFFNWERKLAVSLPPHDLKSHFPVSVRSPVKQSTNTEARTLK